LVDVDLDKLVLTHQFSGRKISPGTEFDAEENRTYYVNEWLIETQVHYNVNFEVQVEKFKE